MHVYLTYWRPDSLRQLHHGSDDDEKMSASTSKKLPLLASNLRFTNKNKLGFRKYNQSNDELWYIEMEVLEK